ncbi:hypothetical protein Scep_010335 [Stephania cephalantha]|uniref:Uncharacterized protein n=1 Tax=Stephania cephalantha TaxID=152367 RepID=A0AAP0JVJ8_9MAGN
MRARAARRGSHIVSRRARESGTKNKGDARRRNWPAAADGDDIATAEIAAMRDGGGVDEAGSGGVGFQLRCDGRQMARDGMTTQRGERKRNWHSIGKDAVNGAEQLRSGTLSDRSIVDEGCDSTKFDDAMKGYV